MLVKMCLFDLAIILLSDSANLSESTSSFAGSHASFISYKALTR